MRLSGQTPNQEAKCASVFLGLMSSPLPLITSLRDNCIGLVNARQIDSGDALQFIGKMEVPDYSSFHFFFSPRRADFSRPFQVGPVSAKARRCFCNS